MSIDFLLQQTLLFAVPLLVTALGGLFSERSGVINIALEGTMIFGGFCGTFFISQLQQELSGQPLLLLALLVSAAAGMLFSLPHAFACVTLHANQIISGTALNLLAPALTVFTARMLQPSGTQQIAFSNTFRIAEVPLLSELPIVGKVLFTDAYLTTFLSVLLLAVCLFLLNRTVFGLRLRACGENPAAAEAAGVRVDALRYAGVLLSGALAGMGGLIYILPVSTNFNHSVSGYGFLALALLIFGKWEPKRIALSALLFGLLKTVAVQYGSLGLPAVFGADGWFYKMLPYLVTLLALIFVSGRSQAPAAAGVPFRRDRS